MIERDAFGAYLRRQRVRAGISLDDIARRTRVTVDMWEALERNDFSRWPSGIYARAYVREYANAIGLDAEEVVNDFCRGFPQGDRRSQSVVRGTAEIVGHDLVWRDDVPPSVPQDRRARTDAPLIPQLRVSHARLLAAGLDLLAVGIASGSIAGLIRIDLWITLAVIAVSYFGASLALLGTTIGAWLVDAYSSAHPELGHRGPGVLFRRLNPRRHNKALERPTVSYSKE
jgi:hypothetical protein